MRDALLRSSSAADQFSAAMAMGNTEFEKNNALTAEAAKRYETAESKIAMAGNAINDAAISFGQSLLPMLKTGAEAVAGFEEDDVERLLLDARIIRNRAKIEATISNARAVVALHEAGETLDELIWSFAPPARERRLASLAEIPGQTPASVALAKELKRRGFRFIGPTTAYAAMQACGLVDDHVATCPVAINQTE